MMVDVLESLLKDCDVTKRHKTGCWNWELEASKEDLFSEEPCLHLNPVNGIQRNTAPRSSHQGSTNTS